MKNLLITGSYPPDHTGSGKRLKLTYNHLRKKYGVNFDVISSLPRKEVLKGNSDEVILWLPNTFRIREFIRLFYLLFSSGRNYDLIHIAGRSRLNIAAAWICILLKFPFVLEFVVDNSQDIHMKNILKRMILKCFSKANGYIAMNKSIEDEYLKNGVDYKDILPRPNAYIPKFDNGSTAYNNKAEIGLNTQFKHLMISRICDRKGYFYALNLIKRLPQQHGLYIRGPLLNKEDEIYLESLKKFISKNNLSNRVKIVPKFLETPELLMKEFDMFWMTSKREGFPNVVIESLCQGTPVVVGAWLSFIDYMTALEDRMVVVTENIDDSVEHVIAFLERNIDPTVTKEKSREFFNLNKYLENTYCFFESIISQ